MLRSSGGTWDMMPLICSKHFWYANWFEKIGSILAFTAADHPSLTAMAHGGDSALPVPASAPYGWARMLAQQRDHGIVETRTVRSFQTKPKSPLKAFL